MKWNITCYECAHTDDHAEWCISRGYRMVGPHPDAPAPETERLPRAAAVECPCGGIRGVCEYHP